MNRRFQAAVAIITIAAFSVSGCATIFTGTSDTITFETNPSGAQVLIDGIEEGRTPLTTEVRRNLGSRSVTLRLDGYETRTFRLHNSFNNVAIANVFCLWGILLCGGVDALTGALFTYDRSMYEFDLEQRSHSPHGIPEVILGLNELREIAPGEYVVDMPSEALVSAKTIGVAGVDEFFVFESD